MTIKYKGLPFECRFQDLRPHISYLVFLAAARHSALHYEVRSWTDVKRLVTNIATNHIYHLGRLHTKNGWRNTELTGKPGTEWPSMFRTLKHLAATQFRFHGCDAVRISKDSR